MLKETDGYFEEFEESRNRIKDRHKSFRELLNDLCNKEGIDKMEVSVEMARLCGVPEDEIIHDMDELNDYFTK